MQAVESSLHAGPGPAPTLAAMALAHLAPAAVESGAAPEADWLIAQRNALDVRALEALAGFAWWRESPPSRDARLHRLADGIGLAPAECCALALSVAADQDLVAGRAIAWLQAPLRDPHPTLGLIACLEEQRGRSAPDTLTALLDGPALASGVLTLEAAERALPDARLLVPRPLLAAITGGEGRWPAVRFAADDASPLLPPTIRAEAMRRAAGLDASLIVRSGCRAETHAVCAAIASCLERRLVLVEGTAVEDPPVGLGPWLRLHDALPVLCIDVRPGEHRRLPALPGYAGPVLVATGLEGTWEGDDDAVASWTVPVPPVDERVALWSTHGLDPDAAAALGRVQRHGAARIARLVRDAHEVRRTEGDLALRRDHVERAARRAERGALGTLAEPLTEDIGDDALVLPPSLRSELEALATRCRVRDELVECLGPASQTRYRPGVRALLVGASGTGKTLACGWLATRLGLPLYQVDLSAVSSKYIGETEKNLAELFARAEHAGVVLMFDEADALFGKRTDVKDAHDRYANQQTNYLLQRIEAYDGIVLLTSNSRARFDSAFTRRLDAILEFPLPQPEERRALWVAHLGSAQGITATELNRLAGSCELAGGHIRNAVLAARAISATDRIGWPVLQRALAGEYRKLGKKLPAMLAGDPTSS